MHYPNCVQSMSMYWWWWWVKNGGAEGGTSLERNVNKPSVRLKRVGEEIKAEANRCISSEGATRRGVEMAERQLMG